MDGQAIHNWANCHVGYSIAAIPLVLNVTLYSTDSLKTSCHSFIGNVVIAKIVTDSILLVSRLAKSAYWILHGVILIRDYSVLILTAYNSTKATIEH